MNSIEFIEKLSDIVGPDPLVPKRVPNASNLFRSLCKGLIPPVPEDGNRV